MFAKVFATSQDAAMLHVVTQALAGFAHLTAALLHLPTRGIAVLSKAAHWD